MRFFSTLILFIFLSSNTYSLDVQQFTTFKCKYEKGFATTYYRDGSIQSQATSEVLEFLFISINLKEQTGRMLFKNLDTRITPIINGDTILIHNIYPDGSSIKTTIYNRTIEDKSFASIHSRHDNGEANQKRVGIIPSQYFGFCNGIRSN